jgi:hypothetical protein
VIVTRENTMRLHNPSFDSPETRTSWDDSMVSELLDLEEKIIREHEADGFKVTPAYRDYAHRKAEEILDEKYAPDFG